MQSITITHYVQTSTGIGYYTIYVVVEVSLKDCICNN